MLGGVAHGPDFHLGTARRDAHHNLEVGGEEAAVLAVHLLDEAADHHFGGIEVGDNAVAQRPYGLDSGVAALVHELGLRAYGDALAAIVIYCDDARLVQHYLVVLIDDGVGRSEVYCEFLIQREKCHLGRLGFILDKSTQN